MWDVAKLVERALSEPMPEPSPLAPFPSGPQPSEQLGLFVGLPGVLPRLLPPSASGTPGANDNDGAAPVAPEVPAVIDAGDGCPEPSEDDEAPATVRDPMELAKLQGGSRSLG